jgi:DNA replication protein
LEQSSSAFAGFPAGKVQFCRLPALFYSDLLPAIDDLGELKLTLYVLWFLDQLEGTLRYMRWNDFISDQRFMQGLGSEPDQVLADALQRAVRRGTLLRGEVTDLEGQKSEGSGPTVEGDSGVYFLNSARGRAALEALKRGKWRPEPNRDQPVALDLEHPNIFQIYEEHIGPLTPMISDKLQEAEQAYPPEWIEEAVRIAVENNVRRWTYVDAILRRWKEEGHHEQHRGDSQEDRRRYIESWLPGSEE